MNGLLARMRQGASQHAGRHEWADELDFVGPRVRTASWSWVLLLAGLTAAVWLWPMVMQADADAVQAQLDLKRLQRAAHQQALATKAAQLARAKGEITGEGMRDGKTMAPSPDAMRHAAQLAQWLGYPWAQVLDQVEEAAQAEKAVMLALSLDIGSVASAQDAQPEVRLAAAVRDDESALRWAQTLGSSAQLRGREKLSAPFSAASGQYDWRVDAAWSGEVP